MAVNPITQSDLISQDAIEALKEMSRLLKEDKENMDALMSTFKEYAASMKKSISENQNNADALAEQARKVSELEKTIGELNKMMKENEKLRTQVSKGLSEETRAKIESAKVTKEEANAQAALSKAEKAATDAKAAELRLEKAASTLKRENGKLTQSEINIIKALSNSYKEIINDLRNGISVSKERVAQIDIQKSSYNELYATYNALNDALKQMTVEERRNTEAGKAMTEQAKSIRDTLNMLQQETGNYTLNVGNYMSAFSGLQMQTQQLLREIPSAQNLSQFFLAISNNIPMFMDALSRYNKGVPEIKDKLAAVTKEIAEQKALLATMDEESAAYKAKQQEINELERQRNQLQGTSVKGWKAVLKAALSWQTLVIAGLVLLRKLPDIINSIIDRIQMMNGEMENTIKLSTAITDATLKTLENTIKEETRLNLLTDALEDATRGSQKFADITAEIGEIIGKNIDPINTEISTIKQLVEEYKNLARTKAQAAVVEDIVSTSIVNEAKRKAAMEAFEEGDLDKIGIILNWSPEELKKYRGNTRTVKLLSAFDQITKGALNLQDKTTLFAMKSSFDIQEAIRSATPYVTEEEREELVKQMWEFVKDIVEKPGGGGTTKEIAVSLEEWIDRFWEMEEAKAKAMEAGYDKEIEIERIAYEKSLEENEIAWDKQNDALDKNLANGLITREEYDAKIRESKEQHDKIQEALELEHQQKMDKIYKDYQKKRDEKIIESIENQYKNELKVIKRRVKTVNDEKQRNADLISNIRKLEAEQEQLRQSMLTMGEEGAQEAQEKIDKLTEAIKKYHAQLQFDRQLSNYSSFWDILQRNGFFTPSDDTMRNIVSNLIEGFDDMDLSDEEIASIFDKWLENAGKAVNTWYSNTMSYINDLIDAYVELANAKAEAAREATEAAQEEYDKEKALLEAGYASRVEATWAEYQEKKAMQEQAEKDAKAAAEAEKQLNEMSTVGSLITASANIYKTLSALGPAGIAAAGVLITAMLGAFAAAKMKASQVAQYGEGTVEMIGGGSHASGHDSPLAYDSRGRQRRVEGGEMFAVFNRRAVRRLGQSQIENLVNGINHGQYEGSVGRMMAIESNLGKVVTMRSNVNLHRVENSLDKLVEYGGRRRETLPNGTVREYRKNGTVTIYK